MRKGENELKPSICVIGVYFGKFNSYFPLWLRSAEWNETVRFLIFTDQEYLELPKNVSIVQMTLEGFKILSQEKMGFDIALDRPYKCCDLKPAYGYIFSEYIGEFDYWAHCDFDMLFGDIRSFFERYSLDEFDKVLTLGHLSLYRNTEENNRRFMLEGGKLGNYREVFSSNKSYGFDELSGMYSIYKTHGFSMFEKRIYADISIKYKRFVLAKSEDNYTRQIFAWKEGKVFRYHIDENGKINSTEYIYIHFRKRGNLPFQNDCLNSLGFWITQKGFGAMPNELDYQEAIKEYNPYRGRMVEMVEALKYQMDIIWFRAKRKFGMDSF